MSENQYGTSGYALIDDNLMTHYDYATEVKRVGISRLNMVSHDQSQQRKNRNLLPEMSADLERGSATKCNGLEMKTNKGNGDMESTKNYYLNPYVPLQCNDMEYLQSYSPLMESDVNDQTSELTCT